MTRLSRAQWGVVLVLAGVLLLTSAWAWGRIPTLEDDRVWDPWWWRALLLGWILLVLGLVLLWPPERAPEPIGVAGAVIVHEPPEGEEAPADSPMTPVSRTGLQAFNQFMAFGTVAAIAVVVGVMLTVEGINPIYGIPLMILGLMVPFAWLSARSRQMLQGPCPFCATPVVVDRLAVGAACPGCKRRLVVRNRQLVGIE